MNNDIFITVKNKINKYKIYLKLKELVRPPWILLDFTKKGHPLDFEKIALFGDLGFLTEKNVVFGTPGFFIS